MVQAATSRVRFDVEPSNVDDSTVVMPVVDGERLADLLGGFEEARGYQPAAGYGGIDTAALTAATVADHYRGLAGLYASRRGAGLAKRLRIALRRGRPLHSRVTLLACNDCGGQGCWPAEVRVSTSDDVVTWSRFANPHRRHRDYGGLGPFVFDRRQYDAALADLTASIASLTEPAAGPDTALRGGSPGAEPGDDLAPDAKGGAG